MPEEPKVRMSLWVEPRDRADMATIREEVGLATDSAAVRYAIRRIARELRSENGVTSVKPRRARAAAQP